MTKYAPPGLALSLSLLLLAACQDDGESFQKHSGLVDSNSEGEIGAADADEDGSPDDEDCAPEDGAISPLAEEVCDGLDNDCDGDADEGVAITVYPDGDGDGYGEDSGATTGCAGEGASQGGDCDDGNANVSPIAAEDCDGVDEDCDGVADDGLTLYTSYTDADGDGYGDDATAQASCSLPAGAVMDAGDCDDTDSATYPGADEVAMDGLDQDCDGADSGHSVYVVERYDGTLAQLSAEDGSAVAEITGLGAMIGVARADDGTLYVSQFDADTISAVSADLSASTPVLTTAADGPHTLLRDPATQTVLIGGYGASLVQELDPSTGTASVLSAAVTAPVGVFRFPDDDVLYVTSRNTRALFAVSGSTGEVLDYLDLPAAGDTISADGPDALWISSGNGSAVYHVDLTTSEVTTLKSGLTNAYGSCLHPDGETVLASEEGVGVIVAVSPDATVSIFSTAISRPWQCVTDVSSDNDGDGLYSAYHGGTDCDDLDADAGECLGGARWPGSD